LANGTTVGGIFKTEKEDLCAFEYFRDVNM
jgi:hypothetical protein